MKNGKVRKSPIDPLDDKVNIHALRRLDTGKYFRQKAAEHRYVQLDEDVHAQFPSAREVNEALREVVRFRNAIGELALAKAKAKEDGVNMDSNRQPGPGTLFTAIAVIFMLAVALAGLIYTAHLLLTLPAKP